MSAGGREQRRIVLLSLFFFFPFFLILFASDTSAESYREKRLFSKRYTFYGTIELSYERRRFEGDDIAVETKADFIQSYTLGLRGYVIDPRLIQFDVSGVVTRSSQNIAGQSYTLLGRSLNMTIFETMPPRWLKYWKYIPNPIMIRYSAYNNYSSGTNDYNYTNYGLSLRYAVPEELRQVQVSHQAMQQQQQGKQANLQDEEDEAEEKDSRKNFKPKQKNDNREQAEGVVSSSILKYFPTTFIDYDHYEYKSEGYRTTSDLLSLRSSLKGQTYEYNLYYDYTKEGGNTDYTRNVISLEPNYKFYDEKTRRLLDIRNGIRYETFEDRRSFDVRSRMNYNKPIEKDNLSITGSMEFINTSSSGESLNTFISDFLATYTRYVSPRFTYAPYVSLAFGKDSNTTTHAERAGSSVNVEISRFFGGNGGVYFGASQNGLEYGLDTSIYTKTKLRLSGGYSFASLSPENGRTVSHRFNLGASGQVLSNVAVATTLQYNLNDVSEPVNPYSEEFILGNANITWRFGKTSVAVGGSYTSSLKQNTTEEKNTVTSVNVNLSQLLTRRTFLNVYGLWLKDSKDNRNIEVRPRMSWTRGQTRLDVEYDYLKSSVSGAPYTTEHRVFVRVVRNFSRNFRL